MRLQKGSLASPMGGMSFVSVPCADAFKNFENSAWGKKLAKRLTKDSETDFQRYQAAVARKKRSEAVKKALKA